MLIPFFKYHGAGNDFIMIDARKFVISDFSEKVVNFLCDRHFGIGSDGLILLTESDKADFRMIYFNSDGKEGTMCGNGGRCITAFAEKLGLVKESTEFLGIDGLHQAKILGGGQYSIKMIDVINVDRMADGYLINTGSKHFVKFKQDLELIDVYNDGRLIRHQGRFGEDGTNVNFIEYTNDNKISIRTFERGVENETLACGTGSVAAAITTHLNYPSESKSYIINARGGQLKVEFEVEEGVKFSNIWLSGPVEFVFAGEIEL
ncbi:MAG: diaminopimelate epimerase [Bacteroidales bacterium]|nr:diaminopimelate epimerase [Bacteroidales bacterium]MCF8391801.1 diaminopimelate epimerase [Bacteroidales bacterium]